MILNELDQKRKKNDFKVVAFINMIEFNRDSGIKELVWATGSGSSCAHSLKWNLDSNNMFSKASLDARNSLA